jgi:hypothetical protein
MKIQPKPTVDKYSGRWWKSEITRAEERRKKFIEASEESIRVYNAQKQVGVLNDAERRLNVWWYCTNTLLPAYYSSTPKAEVNLRKRTGSLPYEMGSVVLERNTQYAMDVHFDFDKVGYQASLQFLLTGQAVLWARYVAEFETVFEEFALIKDPSGQLIDGKGQPFDGDVSTLTEGEGGIFMGSMEVQQKVKEQAILEVVQYNDYYCNDARSEAEIEWQARRAFMDRSQATTVFGAQIADQLTYNSYPEVMKKDIARQDDRFEGKAELYEIWDRPSRKVYWIQKGGDKTLLEVSDPPIKFEKFFPCSVIRQSADPDSVIPVSDYSHVKDQILEVERLTTRIHAVTQAIRTNSLYDATLGNQVEMLMTGDLKLIPVTNWPSYKQRGGLANGIEAMNIEPYINALNVLQGARQTALQQLYETLKVSDLLRGTSEQYKSATANRLENQWSSMGLIVRQNMFAKFVSDAISNLATIIAEQFDPKTIFEISDADALIEPTLPPPPQMPEPMQPPMPMGEPGMEGMPPMEMMPPPPPPYDPLAEIDKVKQQILDILRDDKKRSYRIQIATDSMMAIDQQQQQQEASMLIQTAGGFFDQMRGLIDQYPPLLDFSISLFQNMIKRYKGGKEIDGLFTKALMQIGEIAKAKEQAAMQPPPPDPVMQEVQGRLQIAQIESQARLQSTQMEMQDKAVKNQLSYQDQQLKMQREQLEAQLRVQDQQFAQYVQQQELGIAQQELQIKQSNVQVEMLKVQAATQSDANKQAIQQETNRMAQILELQKLELEQMRIKLSESEKLIEERRLSADSQLERIRISMEALGRTTTETSKQQPIVINNIIPKNKRRRGKVTMDELGNPSVEMEDVEDEEQTETKTQETTEHKTGEEGPED